MIHVSTHALTMAFDQQLRNATYLAMSVVGMSLFARRARLAKGAGALRVLMYHRVNRKRVDSYTISPNRLQKHLDLVVGKYRPITPAELLRSIEERILLPDKSVLLTFDDSLLDHYEHAYPMLKAMQLQALLFMPTDFVVDAGTGDDRRAASCEHESGLEWDQLIQMLDVFTIGSHSRSHRVMATLGREEKLAELTESKRTLEERLRKPVHFFAYPYGSLGTFDDMTESMVAEAGYKASFVTLTGPNPASRLWSGGALHRQGAEPLSRLALARVLDGSCDAIQEARARRRREKFAAMESAAG